MSIRKDREAFGYHEDDDTEVFMVIRTVQVLFRSRREEILKK
jgi:hypothetical protein